MPQNPTLSITAEIETWPLNAPFVISRGAKTSAIVVVATVRDQHGLSGRGECVPYARYNETPEDVVETIRSWAPHPSRQTLLTTLPAGAARNALDCALWDYETLRADTNIATHLDVPSVDAVETAFTLSLATPEEMARAALDAKDKTLLKLKLGGEDGNDAERMQAVRAVRPEARLIGDANEGWDTETLETLFATAHQLAFEVIEQPLPADGDHALADIRRPVPICADESHHTAADVSGLVGKYDAINIKLDKAGGLTAARQAIDAAQQHKLDIMIGSMVATSLSVAPAYCLADVARWVDLDGPLLLERDRPAGFQFKASQMMPPLSSQPNTKTEASRLWGNFG